MRKITVIATVVLLSFTCLLHVCIASENDEIKKIAKQMIKNKEFSSDCLKETKSNPSKMISIKSINADTKIKFKEAYVVEAAQNSCCMGNVGCATWVYKKNERGDGYTKIFGPEYPENLIFFDEDNFGIRQMTVEYPRGNFDPGISESYEFDGRAYKLTGKFARTK